MRACVRKCAGIPLSVSYKEQQKVVVFYIRMRSRKHIFIKIHNYKNRNNTLTTFIHSNTNFISQVLKKWFKFRFLS